MTYNAGSRLVTSVEGAVVSTYTFDANGNQTAVNAGGSRTTYAYDYENRMRTAIDPGGARSTLAYWADGMRRFLEVGGTRTTFVWDGSDYLQSRTPSEVTTFSTVDAQILDSETDGSESLLVPDPLGSVVKVLDASGNQIYDAAYWPYGEIRNSVGVNDTPWGYVGTWGYHFDTSKRLYIRARVLDPGTGRWHTVDPLWPTESAYRYVNSNPVMMIDFAGLQGLDWTPPWNPMPGEEIKDCKGGPRAVPPWAFSPNVTVPCAVCLSLRVTGLQGADKYQHYVAGCLARILCPMCPNSVGSLKEFKDSLLGGTVSQGDAWATDQGWDHASWWFRWYNRTNPGHETLGGPFPQGARKFCEAAGKRWEKRNKLLSML